MSRLQPSLDTLSGIDTDAVAVDLVNELAPAILPEKKLFKGYPDLEKVHRSRFDTTNEKEILSIAYYSKEATTKDMLKEFAQRGW